jgi:hypothetical protein
MNTNSGGLCTKKPRFRNLGSLSLLVVSTYSYLPRTGTGSSTGRSWLWL